MPMVINSPSLIYQIARKENYLERVQAYIDMNLHSLSLEQIAEYNAVSQHTAEEIRLLTLQLHNRSFDSE
jgi:hypothetical protein